MSDKLSRRAADFEDAQIVEDVNPETALVRAETMIKMIPLLAKRFEELRAVCLRNVVNRAADWYLWGSADKPKPRMNDGAAAKLLSFSGISERRVGEPRKVTSDDAKRYYVFYESEFTSPLGGTILAIGSCASDDPFVAAYKEFNQETKKYDRKLKPAEEVSYDDVVKAARANCLVNGVSALMGLKNVEVEELREMGVPVDKIESVSFEKTKWTMPPSGRAALRSVGATDDQIETCKSQSDYQQLLTQLQAAKRASKGEKDAREQAAEAGAASADDKAPYSATNQLGMTAKRAGRTWTEVEAWRKTCFAKGPDHPWTIREVSHANKWLAMGKGTSADDYAAMMQPEAESQGSLV